MRWGTGFLIAALILVPLYLFAGVVLSRVEGAARRVPPDAVEVNLALSIRDHGGLVVPAVMIVSLCIAGLFPARPARREPPPPLRPAAEPREEPSRDQYRR